LRVSAVTEPRGAKVIPKKTAKKFQSTTFSQHEKSRFKHARIYTQVQRGKPKEPQRTPSLHDPDEPQPSVAIRKSTDHMIKAHPKNTSTRTSSFAA
jgi:hypothetical protein